MTVLQATKSLRQPQRPPKALRDKRQIMLHILFPKTLKCSRANNKHSCFLRKKGRLLKLKHVSVLTVFNQNSGQHSFCES